MNREEFAKRMDMLCLITNWRVSEIKDEGKYISAHRKYCYKSPSIEWNIWLYNHSDQIGYSYSLGYSLEEMMMHHEPDELFDLIEKLTLRQISE